MNRNTNTITIFCVLVPTILWTQLGICNNYFHLHTTPYIWYTITLTYWSNLRCAYCAWTNNIYWGTNPTAPICAVNNTRIVNKAHKYWWTKYVSNKSHIAHAVNTSCVVNNKHNIFGEQIIWTICAVNNTRIVNKEHIYY